MDYVDTQNKRTRCNNPSKGRPAAPKWAEAAASESPPNLDSTNSTATDVFNLHTIIPRAGSLPKGKGKTYSLKRLLPLL